MYLELHKPREYVILGGVFFSELNYNYKYIYKLMSESESE